MRRTLIIALLVLAVSLAACLAGAGYVGRSVAEADGLRAQAERAVSLGDGDGAARAIQTMGERWRARERVLELMTSHDALADVRGAVGDALICLDNGDTGECLRALSAAGVALERIRAAEAVRLANLS